MNQHSLARSVSWQGLLMTTSSDTWAVTAILRCSLQKRSQLCQPCIKTVTLGSKTQVSKKIGVGSKLLLWGMTPTCTLDSDGVLDQSCAKEVVAPAGSGLQQ